jgi:peptidoglycan/LPS O-acetylase OafA/YrhL
MVHLAYRRDIDGLRALAIIPVVLFHADIPGFSGGFVGVDVFFVISGYLITSIILRELNNGTFSLSDFWARRAKRILPAMFVVIASVLIAGWFLLAPLDYQDLGRAARYQALFASNIYFWESAGYFDLSSESKPLLHMWSLAVEEQFYLFFPFVCLLLARLKSGLFRLYGLMIIALASLVASVYFLEQSPAAVFYLLPARAWELLAGAILAHVMLSGRARPTVQQAQIASMLGLISIVGAVVLYDADMAFPGPGAVIPVIGALLLIWANTWDTWAQRLLSAKMLVGVGLISFSLYLWHWPLLAFATYMWSEGITLPLSITLVAASVILAYASWRWVETPFRNTEKFQVNKRVLQTAFAVMIVFVLVGQEIRKKEGYPLRLPEDARRYALDREWFEHQKECVRMGLDEVLAEGPCRIHGSGTDFSPKLIAWGDSHNAAMMPALEVLAEEFGIDVLFAARSSCQPIASRSSADESDCDHFNHYLYEVMTRHGIKDVILTGRWSQAIYGEEVNRPGFVPSLTEEQFAAGFREMAYDFKALGVRLWVVREVPLQSFDIPVRLTKLALNGGRTTGIGRNYSDYKQQQRLINPLFDSLESDYFRTLNPAGLICSDGKRCIAAYGGHSLYKDDDHLSVYGAKFVAPALRPIFETVLVGAGANELKAAKRP